MDIDLELRMRLMRAQPKLKLAHANSLICDVASSCLDVRDDAIACGIREREDFFTFAQVDDAALAAVFRQFEVEFLTFAADESLIHETEHLAMVDVAEFLEFTRKRFQLSEDRFVLPTSRALPWMEQHRNSNREG